MHVTWGLNMITALHSPTTGRHFMTSYTIMKMSHSVIKHQRNDGLETFFSTIGLLKCGIILAQVINLLKLDICEI